MASGRWYIAFPSGPFRFSTRIACNRYFRRTGPCVRARVCRGFPRTCARGCTRRTRMNARDLYTFTCARVRIYVMSEFQVSGWHVPSTLAIQEQLLWKHSSTRVVHYIPGSISTADIFFYRKMFGIEIALDSEKAWSFNSKEKSPWLRSNHVCI